MPTSYSIEITEESGENKIVFSNNTGGWVEVLFEIDGKELRTGRPFSRAQRGYCYPPRYRNHQKIESAVPFRQEGGVVRAHVFSGTGSYKYDLDIPAFLRKSLKQKAIFKRISVVPVEIMNIAYNDVRQAGFQMRRMS